MEDKPNYPLKATKILVLGQTPPPYHGQAMMTFRLLDANLESIKIYHVRMSFSQSIKSIGNFEIGKVFHMYSIVGKAIYQRFRYKIKILYYMPAGPNLTPILRDIFMLSIIRIFFPKVIFHFRASGLSAYIEQKGSVLKWLAKRAYNKPDLAIHLSSLNPDDGGYFKAKKKVVVQNGLEDEALPYLPISRPPKAIVNVLFVGIINESKGVLILIEAIKKLRESNHQVRLTLVGDFVSEEFKLKVLSYCQQHSLEGYVHFAGVKQGDEKWRYFLDADIFCFPSFYESESFGNVVVEAMMFELPVVASHWRGIPDIVDDGTTGFLVPVKDACKTASALQTLISDYPLRIKMGTVGRQKYLHSFRLDNFLNNMQKAFLQV